MGNDFGDGFKTVSKRYQLSTNGFLLRTTVHLSSWKNLVAIVLRTNCLPENTSLFFQACDEALRRLVEWCQPKTCYWCRKICRKQSTGSDEQHEYIYWYNSSSKPSEPSGKSGMAKTGRETASFAGHNNLISIIDLPLFTSIPIIKSKNSLSTKMKSGNFQHDRIFTRAV